MPGPTKAPAKLRLLGGRAEGRDSGGRKVETPPPFERVAANPPEYLTAFALQVWREVMPELERLELVKGPDAHQLAAYCLAVDRLRKATADIGDNGLVHEVEVYGPEGTAATEENRYGRAVSIKRTANPAVGVAEKASSTIRAFAVEFGLTPAAEAKIAALTRGDGGESGDGNPFATTG